MFYFIFGHNLLLTVITVTDNLDIKLKSKKINAIWQQSLNLFDYI